VRLVAQIIVKTVIVSSVVNSKPRYLLTCFINYTIVALLRLWKVFEKIVVPLIGPEPGKLKQAEVMLQVAGGKILGVTVKLATFRAIGVSPFTCHKSLRTGNREVVLCRVILCCPVALLKVGSNGALLWEEL
jgi:hypothetical protein